MKIIGLGIKSCSAWSRTMTVEYKGRKYKGTIEYSDDSGFVVDFGSREEITNEIYELISEDCFQVSKDEALVER